VHVPDVGGHYAVYELCTSVSLPGRSRPEGSPGGARGREEFGTEVVVQRRFSEFQRLHEHIVSAYSGTCYTVPALPPKTWMLRRFDLPFLVDRKRRLQHYLQGILLLPSVAENADLRAFVMANDGHGQGRAGAVSAHRQAQQTDEI
jgi:hypothetical protein